MAGIVTTSTGNGSIRVYRAVFTSTSTSLAINFVTGTTSGISGVVAPLDKGVGVIFQNQSTAANIVVGGADVSVGGQGIVIAAQSATNPGLFQWSPRHAPSAISMSDWYITSTSSLAAGVAVLLHAV